MIQLTEKARQQAEMLQAESSDFQGKPLRLYIEGKGCDGFYYGVTFDDQNENDEVFHQGTITIVIDPDSYIFCRNVTIKWVDDKRGKGFLVVNHDQRKFRGKFYKSPDWQEKLRAEP